MAETITKNRQDIKVICRMCEKAFDAADIVDSVQELTDGFCNTAYDIQLRDKRAVILKIAPAEGTGMMSYEVDMMKTEVAAMKYVAEHKVDGVPKVYFYDDSREICNSAYFFMEKLSGKSYAALRGNMSEGEIADINRQTGSYLRKLHGLTSNTFGHFCRPDLQRDTLFDAFFMMMQGVISDGIAVGIDIGVPYEQILTKLKSHRKYFEEVQEVSFIHWDSWDGNIFVEEGKLIGLIDWERAIWGDPLMEDRFRTHTVNRDFLEGYGIKELSFSQQIRSMWYDLYLYLIMMFEGTYRHYPTDDQYRWAHSVFMPVWERISKPGFVVK